MTGRTWRRGIVTVTVGLLPFLAAPATAQDIFIGSFFGGAGIQSETSLPVTGSGALVVTFHGDQSAGCAARGLCGYSGSVTIRPGMGGDISVLKLRTHRRVSYELYVTVGGPFSGGFTLSQVERMEGGHEAGRCVDVQQENGLGSGSSSNGVVTLGLLEAGGGSLLTRCAGPLDSDVAPATPTVALRIARLLRGRLRMSLTGSQPFAAGGFSGTVRSTIVLRIGKPSVQSSPSGGAGGFPPGVKTTRVRLVTEVLHVVRAAGQLNAAFRGTGDPTECQLIDVCGLSGTFTAALNPRRASAELFASGPAARPYRDFLTALGLSRRGRSSGIHVDGYINWDGGSFGAAVRQSGLCSDTGPLGGGDVSLGTTQGRLLGSYSPNSLLRTRCPGPFQNPVQTLASGTSPRSDIGRNMFSLELDGTHRFGDDTYSGVSRSHLSFVLRRGRLTQHVSVQPTGSNP